MRRAALLLSMCACGPVTGVAADTDTSSSSTQASLTDAASVTANSTVPPQEASSFEVGSYDAVSYPESGFEDGAKLDMYYDDCPQVIDVYQVPSAVALLVDASQTMVTQLVDHDGIAETPEITRWAMATNAVIEHAPQLYEAGWISVQSFPAFVAEAPPSTAACDVDPAHPAFGSGVEAIVGYLPPVNATFMLGATPTASAILTARTEIEALSPGSSAHIVLITDGAPNCTLDASAPQLFEDIDLRAYVEAVNAASSGIAVHVIGIDVPSGTVGGGPEGDAITDHRAALTQLADAGGGAAIFVEDATVLDLVLDAIADDVEDCRFVEPAAFAGVWYHVIIGNDRYYYELSPELCANNSGWYRSTQGGVEVIQMCGAACDSLRLHGAAILEEECVIAE
ncbi:MAG TPA: hypothetical protein VG755_44120 [Nannocystaceae bacterium]|nr:hypothetical protein [Nannocystaceae bacterium]